jgi:septal ring factor EnvC (AmiA/AmiB activator)
MSNNDVAMAVNDAARSKQQLDSLNRQYAALQSKAHKQRNEIARLNHFIEEIQKENQKLLAQIRWMKGET